MASAPEQTGNERLFSREQTNTIAARALGREMRLQKITNEQLEKLCGVPERQIESYRSHTEIAPIPLCDLLSIASILGPRFLTGIFTEINMYAAEFNGHSPEKIGAEIVELARKLTGEP